MGKCPKCGRAYFILRKETCIVCGSQGCTNCMTQMCKLTISAGSSGKTTKLYYCLENCQENFIINVEKEVTPEKISLGSEEIPVHTFVDCALQNGDYHLNEWFSKRLSDMHAKEGIREI